MSGALSVNVNFDVNDTDAALNWWFSWRFYIRVQDSRLPSVLQTQARGQGNDEQNIEFLFISDVEVDVDVIYVVERVQATSATLYTHTQGLCCTTFGKWFRAIFSAALSFILVASDRHCTMLGFICGAFFGRNFSPAKLHLGKMSPIISSNNVL